MEEQERRERGEARVVTLLRVDSRLAMEARGVGTSETSRSTSASDILDGVGIY